MRKVLAGTTTLVCMLLAGCAASEGSMGPQEVQVQIMRDSGVGHYHPEDIEVAVGSTVVWTNRTAVAHNVVFKEPSIQSSNLFNEGETFSTNFERTGTFEYYCTLHPTMRGAVTVK
jgi:plastocyanin